MVPLSPPNLKPPSSATAPGKIAPPTSDSVRWAVEVRPLENFPAGVVMVIPPARSTCTDLEMRHSPNITATALSIPKPTIHPTIIRTTLRVPLDGVTAAAGACPTATCPAGVAPAGVAPEAAKPVGAPQPWQNLVSADSSAPHFEQKLAMGIPPVIGVIYHIKRRRARNSLGFCQRHGQT